jgi:hypothetical protein
MRGKKDKARQPREAQATPMWLLLYAKQMKRCCGDSIGFSFNRICLFS